MKITKRLIKQGFLLAAAIILFVVLIINFREIFSIIRLILLGTIFAYILTPICELLEQRFSRTIVVAMLVVVILASIAVIIFILMPRFFAELKTAADKLPEFIESARKLGGKMQDGFARIGIPEKMRNAVFDYSKKLEDTFTKYISIGVDKLIKGLSSLPDIVLVPVLGFYFLKDREYFSKVITDIMPKAYRNSSLRIFKEINMILHQFIRGQILVSAIVSVLTTLGYWAIGLPYSLILGLFMGTMEIIPYFGPWLGAIPAILISVINGPAKIIWTVIVILLIQQLENGIITPKILGNEVQLHPVYVILSIWAGGIFFGLLGMLFAIPVVLILRIIFKHAIISITTSK